MMMRRAARRAARRHGRSATELDPRQLTLDLERTAGAALPLKHADDDPATGSGADPRATLDDPGEPATRRGVILDATEHLARAAAKRRTAPAAPPVQVGDDLAAEQWSDAGCELEAQSPAQACNAYHRALALDPALADAHVTLGRLYHEAGDHAKAEAHYRAAAQYAPGDPIAWFNLGVLLEDTSRPEDAVHAYEQAIQRDPDYADAHYNLGLLFDRLGRRAEALSRLIRARRLYGQSGPQ